MNNFIKTGSAIVLQVLIDSLQQGIQNGKASKTLCDYITPSDERSH